MTEQTDPLDKLGLDIAADHAATKSKTRTRKPKSNASAAPTDDGQVEDNGSGEDDGQVEAPATPDETPPDQPVADAIQAATDDGATANVASATTQALADRPPPSPGDDAETVFARRMDRLSTIAEEAEFDTGTAFGDLRDCLIDLFQHRPKLWPAMTPSERNGVVRHIEGVARQVLQKVVLVIAQDGDDTIQGTLDKKWSVNGETLEAKVKIDNADNDTLADLFKVAGHKIVIVSADAVRFMQARRSQEQGDDQTEMTFAPAPKREPNEVPPAPAHPADDSDLAGEDDETAEEEEVEAQAGDDWGVFDTERGEWLIDKDGGDDGWTSNSGDAGRWPHDEAKALAADFGDGGDAVVARQLGDDPAPAEEAQAES